MIEYVQLILKSSVYTDSTACGITFPCIPHTNRQIHCEIGSGDEFYVGHLALQNKVIFGTCAMKVGVLYILTGINWCHKLE